jgi:hypothetical protein
LTVLSHSKTRFAGWYSINTEGRGMRQATKLGLSMDVIPQLQDHLDAKKTGLRADQVMFVLERADSTEIVVEDEFDHVVDESLDYIKSMGKSLTGESPIKKAEDLPPIDWAMRNLMYSIAKTAWPILSQLHPAGFRQDFYNMFTTAKDVLAEQTPEYMDAQKKALGR